MGQNTAVEALESRRLLATTGIFSGSPGASYTGSGVTSSWTIGADTSSHYSQGCGLTVSGSSVTADNYTLNLSGLPAHSMVQFQVDEEAGPWHAEDGSGTLKVVAGDSTQTTSYSNYYNPYSFSRDYSANFGKWFANSGSSLSITLSAESMTANCGYFVPEVTVAVYQPTVTLGGGGSTDEDDATPTGFNITRDAPGGYQGTSYGDEAVPSTTVQLASPTGSATEGTDYETLPRSVTLPSASTAAAVVAQKLIPLVPKDDPDAEGIEDIFLSLTQPQVTAPYQLAAVPATAPATNAATQKVSLDDNVSVKSIAVITVPGGSNTSNRYNFRNQVVVKGEHLDKVEIQQKIQSSTTMIDYNGHNLTRAEILQLLQGHGDPIVIDSNGQFVVDTGWSWLTLTPDAGTAQGTARVEDNQKIGGIGTATVPHGNGTTTINWLVGRSVYFNVETRKVGTTATLASFEWGYKWNNYDSEWTAAQGAPHQRCAAEFIKSKGVFSEIQGITGLDALN